MTAEAAARRAADLRDATGECWRTPARQRGCPGCGLFQLVPSLLPGSSARCMRCGTLLRRAREDPLGRALALNLAALSILAIAGAMPLMTVSTAGMVRHANLFSGPELDFGQFRGLRLRSG